jgi:cytochrome c553
MLHRPFFAVMLLVLALVSCLARTPRPTVTSTDEQEDASELALLMRAMAVHADSVKAAVNRGDRKLPAKPDFAALFSATPTEGMHIDPITFPTFGQDYLHKVDALYKAARKDRPKAYNALVMSCANCHGTHCPGPLMRINKMYVPLP